MLLTFYRVCAKRGGLLSDIVKVAGVVVHDHWKPYYTMQGVKHAAVQRASSRELKALIEIEKEDWRARCNALLPPRLSRGHLAKRTRRCVETRPDRPFRTPLRRDHRRRPRLPRSPAAAGDEGRRQTPRPRHRARTGHNLLLRFATRREDTLRFLHDPTVPFTNNEVRTTTAA